MKDLFYEMVDRLVKKYIDFRVEQEYRRFEEEYHKARLEETEDFVKPPKEYIN